MRSYPMLAARSRITPRERSRETRPIEKMYANFSFSHRQIHAYDFAFNWPDNWQLVHVATRISTFIGTQQIRGFLDVPATPKLSQSPCGFSSGVRVHLAA